MLEPHVSTRHGAQTRCIRVMVWTCPACGSESLRSSYTASPDCKGGRNMANVTDEVETHDAATESGFLYESGFLSKKEFRDTYRTHFTYQKVPLNTTGHYNSAH